MRGDVKFLPRLGKIIDLYFSTYLFFYSSNIIIEIVYNYTFYLHYLDIKGLTF